jgi:galactitol PTS system EIIA component
MSNTFDLDSFQINKDLVSVRMKAQTAAEVITQLSNIFIDQGYARPSFTAAAIGREETAPTGLPTAGFGTAVPHADIVHTLKPGIAVGTLEKPVKFGQLGDPDNQIDISIVFLLSITQPKAQVFLLESLIEIYKHENLLRKMQAATDPKIIVDMVNAALMKVKSINNSAA